MKLIRLIERDDKVPVSYLVKGVHKTPSDPPFAVPDDFADDLVKLGTAEIVGGQPLQHKGFVAGQDANDIAGQMVDAYTPAGIKGGDLTKDDPTHAARALGSDVEEYPGLQQLAAAGHPHARQSGRYGPAKPSAQVDDPAEPATTNRGGKAKNPSLTGEEPPTPGVAGPAAASTSKAN